MVTVPGTHYGRLNAGLFQLVALVTWEGVGIAFEVVGLIDFSGDRLVARFRGGAVVC